MHLATQKTEKDEKREEEAGSSASLSHTSFAESSWFVPLLKIFLENAAKKKALPGSPTPSFSSTPS